MYEKVKLIFLHGLSSQNQMFFDLDTIPAK